MSLRFHNCPECDAPTFIKADDESNQETMACEHCGAMFNVLEDTRPFEMCTKISGSDAVYAC